MKGVLHFLYFSCLVILLIQTKEERPVGDQEEGLE